MRKARGFHRKGSAVNLPLFTDTQSLALVPGALDGYWVIACEESATVRSEFEALGIKVISCDLKPSRKPGNHYQGDVRDILFKHKWAGAICHPVCRFLTNSGVRWLLENNPNPSKLSGIPRWQAMFEAAEFFRLFQQLECPYAIENPIPHKYAKALIGNYDQLIQPHSYGHLETKAICLWLNKLPKLVATDNVKEEMLKLPKSQTHKVHYASSTLADREEVRSTFFAGIGRAMATQWGLTK